jgi:leader peptidase (prepilin peptidase)/N-methyltransferase
MPFWFNALVAFVYGTVVGSFLNVCIYRMPHDESIITPPSHCPKCDTKLRAPDLAPLISFLMLGRKCRYCGTPISWRYFGIELLTGLTFVAIIWKFDPFNGGLVDLLTFALFGAALIAITFIDLDHWIIPDQLSFFGIALGILRDVYGLVMHEPGHSLMRIPIPFTDASLPMLWSVAAMFMCGAVFVGIDFLGRLLFLRKPGEDEGKDEKKPKPPVEEEGDDDVAMGGGDVKLAAAIGAVFAGMHNSWMGPGLAFFSFFVAVFTGSMIGIGYALITRQSMKRLKLPFGPMMVAGVFVALFFGNFIIGAYLKYIGQ